MVQTLKKSNTSRLLLTLVFSLAGFLVSLMFRGTSVSQLYQTSSRLLSVIPQALSSTGKTFSSEDHRPTGLIAKSGIELLTFGTPNGHKVSIMLEELKEAYGRNYTYQSIDISKNVQKEPWYTKLCPNGRIPVIVDHDRGGFAVMEGAAILAYLTRRYDPERKFSFEYDTDDYSTAEQWVAWQHGGLGPMQGQANHFYRLAPERIPYPTQRYLGETARLYGILDARLRNRDYLAGPGRGRYSIADIANFSWVNVGFFAGVDVKQFENLWAWAERIEAREAVRRGVSVPKESKLVNRAFEERMEGEEGFKDKEAELRELGDKAKEQYGYKYSSP